MPRVARVDAPGVVHHVMIRGIERRPIFADDDDRRDLATRLARIAPECHATCFAWAFMPNHAHLVVRTDAGSVSRLMARVGTGYARRFNERHERVGHLFQNRFRSRIVADDADLICVIRYVHLNPVVAGIVSSLEDLAIHPWTGHAGLLGRIEAQPFHAVRETLRVFGGTPREARGQLVSLMEVGLEEAAFDSRPSSGPEASLRTRGEDARIAAAAAELCRRFELEVSTLRSRARDRAVSRARAAVAVRAVHELGVPLTRVARWLGVSKGSLSRAVARSVALGTLLKATKATEQERPQGNAQE